MQKGRRYQNLSDSQNFITNGKLIRRIIGFADFHANDTVLEIGTGKGHLTEELCRRAGMVCSVELDRKLYDSAGKRLAQYSNVKLIYGDFLKYDLPTKGTYRVFAKIPYSITTQIIDKLTRAPNPPTDIWLVMEKGAAKRFTGVPKETKKSLLLKVNWDIKIRYHFRREDFHPMPGVDSVLVHFTGKTKPDLSRNEYYAFQKFIERSMKYGVTLYIQWLCLFRCYRKMGRERNG